MNIHGPDKGVRAIRRQIRALPLLARSLEHMGVLVSVVPGNVRRTSAAACCFAPMSRDTSVHDEPLGFSRIDVSPALCADLDRGEPGMGVRLALSGEAAMMLSRHIPADLRAEAVGIVLSDGQRVLEAARARSRAGRAEAVVLIDQARHDLPLVANAAARWEAACTAEAVRPVFASAPGAPAPHVWPEYWRTALKLALAEERRLGAAKAPPAARARTLEDEAIRACVAAHMPYNGEMISADPRWSLPRRLLEGGIAAMQARAQAMEAAFVELRAALDVLPPSPREQVRRAISHASHVPGVHGAASARDLASDVHAFGSDSALIEAGRLAEPLLDVLVERAGSLDGAFAVLRDASLHIAHVAAMTKTCCPASARERAGVLCLIAGRPTVGTTLVHLSMATRPTDVPDARKGAGTAARRAAGEAHAACDFFACLLSFSRNNAAEGRAQAMTRVGRALDALLENPPMDNGSRKPVDLWRLIIGGGGIGSLTSPAAWADMEAGTIAGIAGFGRTGDGDAFAAAATALRAGLAHRIAVERAAALPDGQSAVLCEAGAAYGRISAALGQGLRFPLRFSTLADDLATIRRAADLLPPGFAAPISWSVTDKLAYEFGTRGSMSCRTHTDERQILPHEVPAADASAAWLAAAASADPGNRQLGEAAAQVAQALASAREVAEAMAQPGRMR